MGGAAMASALPTAHTHAAPPESRQPNHEDAPMRIDSERVHERNQNRSTVASRHGMVCASQPLATLAGVDVLRSGGNAIDAAVCANAMLSLVEPMNCGPGGDLFAIVWIEKDQRLYGLNASGRSPYDWSLKAAQDLGMRSIPATTPLAWSVPGCVSGWGALLDRFGSRSMADVVAPTIACAREGFPVTPIIAADWGFEAELHPTLAETFMPDGRAPAFGEIFTNPDLAAFFETLSDGGAEAFYEGEVAERIVKFSKENGGRFSKKDFADHEVTWVDPVTTSYRGYDVWEIPPNGQGIATLQILNLLEHFDIAGMTPNSAEQLHLFIEAKRLAFEDRATYYADMDFADVPVKQLISKEYAAERVKRIDPKRAATDVGPGALDGSTDTIYLTAADADGNMISLIQSTYYGWGSHIVPDRLGFPIQNRGKSFALDPNHPNCLKPHKRPFHTIIPAFVTRDGAPVFSYGVMGGDFQPQGQSQVLMNLVDYGMSPQQAGEQPRVEHSGSSEPTGQKANGPGHVRFERHIPDAVKQALADMGHQLNDRIGAFGGYQGIWREEDPRRYFGGTDPRKDGCAIGY
ncbi:MAG: gamma-glutamyltransferase [bacterium]|nr:gamma-glutamyltransferase [bacterium]